MLVGILCQMLLFGTSAYKKLHQGSIWRLCVWGAAILVGAYYFISKNEHVRPSGTTDDDFGFFTPLSALLIHWAFDRVQWWRHRRHVIMYNRFMDTRDERALGKMDVIATFFVGIGAWVLSYGLARVMDNLS